MSAGDSFLLYSPEDFYPALGVVGLNSGYQFQFLFHFEVNRLPSADIKQQNSVTTFE